MFDGNAGPEVEAPAPPADPAVAGWAVPGAPTATPDAAPAPAPADPAATGLIQAVDALLAQDLRSLPGPVALGRGRTLLAQVERLGVAAGDALADLGERELWADDGAGSLAGWLRQQPCGDAGRLTRSTRLAARRQVRDAVLDGQLGHGTADQLSTALHELPETTEPGQVEGVLTGAVPELLSRWTARNALDPTGDPTADDRAAQAARAIADGLAATTATPAHRLEAAYVLLGQAISPAALSSQLQLLADALTPERLTDAEHTCHHERALVLTKKRLQPGYRLRGELTDEVGAALRSQLDARAAAREHAARLLHTATQTGSTDPEQFGTAGPGTVPSDGGAGTDGSAGEDGSAGTDGSGSDDSDDDQIVDGPPRLTDAQLAHDLLGELLEAAAGARQPGAPTATAITIVCGLDQLNDQLGALPATVLLPEGPFGISPDALRRHGCSSTLNAVLLDAAHTPIGASGNHRHATARERRAMHAIWGHYCAGNGCGSTDTIPHHVDPWWHSGTTRLSDLIPLCKSNHHDIHDGHRTLRLRDGRLINQHGWVTEDRHPPPDACPEPD